MVCKIRTLCPRSRQHRVQNPGSAAGQTLCGSYSRSHLLIRERGTITTAPTSRDVVKCSAHHLAHSKCQINAALLVIIHITIPVIHTFLP